MTDDHQNQTDEERNSLTQHGGRRQAIVELLLEDIIQGIIQAEERLITQRLSERYKVSHTPIREALITLSGIGIVNLEPNRGAIVRPITDHHVREISEFRSLLECEATRLACGKVGHLQLYSLRDRLQNLVNVTQKLGVPAIQDSQYLDDELHDLIANSCGNSFLTKELHRLKILFRTFRNVRIKVDLARYDHQKLIKEATDHLEITNLLLAEDKKLVVKKMAQHIEDAYFDWIETLASIQSNKHKLLQANSQQN
jgi:DNA-binding GntR family transcriptional regulator